MTNAALFWFRRDLRLHDNAGLYQALKNQESVRTVFVFDTDILGDPQKKLLLSPADRRMTFIYDEVQSLKTQLQELSSDLQVQHGRPLEVFKEIYATEPFTHLYCNTDYEPAARKRDQLVEDWCASKGIQFCTFKDQTIFEKDEILNLAGKPYTVYTPYKKRVLKELNSFYLKSYPTKKYFKNFKKIKPSQQTKMPTLTSLGFQRQNFKFPSRTVAAKVLKNYAETRDIPGLTQGTSRLGIHLRFGTISVRELARQALKPESKSDVFLSELIWRDFFMQILWHHPEVESASFRPIYDKIAWRKSKADFKRWSEGQTGYPLVDAGMRELNATGFMHNRVRMVTASFLCKHLLTYWLQGERYFAEKLLDYDLAANNGNWQWAAGSGCDAAPYFRVFNPAAQAKRFDPESEYIRKWVPEFGSDDYVKPMVDAVEARSRCLFEYGKILKGKRS